MIISNKYFNSCTLYILLWSLYSLQGMLYVSGSIISRAILLILLIWSLYQCYVVNTRNKFRDLPAFIKIVDIFLLMHTIYGGILMLSGKQLYITEGDYILTSNFEYLKTIYMSLLPLYVFYNYSRNGRITEYVIRVAVLLLLSVTIIIFFGSYQQRLAEAMSLRSTRDEFTLNVGYEFLHIIPLLFFWNKKPVMQYSLLIICVGFIIMCMKRGAIIIGVVCVVYFLFSMLKSTKGIKKFTIVLMSILAIVATASIVQNLLETSDYFQYRIDQTLEGNSSNRDILYSQFFNHFINEQSPLKILFGNGANATLIVGMNYAHNDWLELAINCGMLGLVVYLLYFIALIKHWIRSKHNNLVYNILGMTTIIMFASTLFSMSYNNLSLSIVLCLGYCLGQSQQKKSMPHARY